MAVSKKSLANLKPPVKGEIRNPEGGRAHNKELKAVKKLTNIEVHEVMDLVLKNGLQAVNDIANDPNSSTLKIWIASIVDKGIKKGDPAALNILLDRTIGKVKETLTVTIDAEIAALKPDELESRTVKMLTRIAARKNASENDPSGSGEPSTS